MPMKYPGGDTDLGAKNGYDLKQGNRTQNLKVEAEEAVGFVRSVLG